MEKNYKYQYFNHSPVTHILVHLQNIIIFTKKSKRLCRNLLNLHQWGQSQESLEAMIETRLIKFQYFYTPIVVQEFRVYNILNIYCSMNSVFAYLIIQDLV